MSETPESPAELRKLQGWMQQALLYPRTVSEADADAKVIASPQLSGAERLAIYQRSYFARLLKCMEEQFPVLRHCLSSALFADFAQQYFRQLPSQSYTLYELGARFPDYLQNQRPDRGPDTEHEVWIDFMIDLAQYERDLLVMYDAPGNEGNPFATESTPDASLYLQPAFALHQYRFKVFQYYHERRTGGDPQIQPPETSRIVLVRKDFLTHTYPISENHYKLLSAMMNGKSLEQVLVDSGENIPEKVRQHWIRSGFFTANENLFNKPKTDSSQI